MGAACRKESDLELTPGFAAGENSPLSELSDDLILQILSFVSFAPNELDVSLCVTLSDLSSQGYSLPDDGQVRRLIQDYNSTKLNKALLKRKSSVSPFRPQGYFMAAVFSGNAGNETPLYHVSTPKTFGTLTHVLPLICKRFCLLCTTNYLWEESLERLMGVKNNTQSTRSDIGSCGLWEKGVMSFIDSLGSDGEGSATRLAETLPSPFVGVEESGANSEAEKIRALVTRACALQRQQRQQHDQKTLNETASSTGVAREVFRQVCLRHKPTRLPVFRCPAQVMIGEAMGVRLHERRYRLLIAELMAGRTQGERNGFPLAMPRPRFLFACCRQHTTWQWKGACVAEVRRCRMHRDGTADVMLVPVSWEVMQDISIRPDSGELSDATIMSSPRRTQLPVFSMMSSRLVSGEAITLRLFQPRYKLLASELMEGRSESERNGSLLAAPLPRFVYAHENLRTGSGAFIVEVERCHVHSSGIADIVLVPRSAVLIEKLAIRPNSFRLFEATVLSP